MTLWLFIPTVLFAYLAYDAWRLRPHSQNMPYEVEEKVRGESVSSVPLEEQARRKAWNLRYGVGKASDIVWVWLVLTLGCLAGAVLERISFYCKA